MFRVFQVYVFSTINKFIKEIGILTQQNILVTCVFLNNHTALSKQRHVHSHRKLRHSYRFPFTLYSGRVEVLLSYDLMSV